MESIALIEVESFCGASLVEQKITSLNFYFISEFSELRLKRIAGLAPKNNKKYNKKLRFLET